MRIVLEEKYCFGCGACMVACLDTNSLPEGKEHLRIKQTENGRGQEVKVSFSLSSCLQCEDPLCLNGCANFALSKGSDGVVRINADRCRGCGSCAARCPEWAIHLVRKGASQKARKCELCGGTPVCVSSCPVGALRVE